ncbi:alpha/beta hydrolase [Stenotrophomonas indicatrix]|nr:alpha/beta hydrolase [Stenotrophomonas indicatrix]MCR8716681.1 alpha/beta hydrolase [Stenotrophomonas indicatrix]
MQTATVPSCEFGPLRDEAEQYAAQLHNAGMDFALEQLPGMIHVCIHLRAVSAATDIAIQRAAALCPTRPFAAGTGQRYARAVTWCQLRCPRDAAPPWGHSSAGRARRSQ